MTVTVKNIIPAKQAENSQTTQYTAATATKCLIDKFTVTNTTAATVTFSVNLVLLAGAAGAANRVLSLKGIAAGETYTCPEVVGQTLEAGDFISTLASAATSLTLMASGREIT
jgi:hypothetical protein